MAKKITPAQRAAAISLPTTGNGRDHRQKPNLSETNLQGARKPGFIARLLTRASEGGRHSAN